MTACPFCRILAGELPSSPVLEDELVLAILDIRPANPGHTLVMPRRHVEFFTDLTPAETQQLALAGQRVASALKLGFDCAKLSRSHWPMGQPPGRRCRILICTWSRDGLAMASDGERPALCGIEKRWTRRLLGSEPQWTLRRKVTSNPYGRTRRSLRVRSVPVQPRYGFVFPCSRGLSSSNEVVKTQGNCSRIACAHSSATLR